MSAIHLNNLVIQVRRDILEWFLVNSGHPGGSLGCAEFLVALYSKIMLKKDEFEMNGLNEDIFSI